MIPVQPAPAADTSWLEHAACKGTDPSIFFPGRGDTRHLQQAQAVCAHCPVRNPCLQYALASPYLMQGVWGGTSERERRRIRLQANADRRRQEMLRT
jgi:WhiB family transcriptional regulator, redox-sensing transcriptional regulator